MKYRQGITTPGDSFAPAAPASEPVPAPAEDAPPFDVDDALDRAEEDTL